jgi:hypothetical protein
MLTIRACNAKPSENAPAFKLPKRMARARRVMESKRMDSLKGFHEALVKTAKEEQTFLKDLFKTRDDEEGGGEAAADEAAAENEEE